MGYDIIGDVHGQSRKLEGLLEKLGYRLADGAYRHPGGRKAVFLGDLIDRGPGQIEVVDTVRKMIEADSARCIMGNHEWNAIGYGTPKSVGAGFLRERTDNKRKQHAAFLAAVGEDSPRHRESVEWFATLPPVLELEGIRVCHAWWRPEAVEVLRSAMDSAGRLDQDFLVRSFEKGSPEWKALHNVTSGHEVALPAARSFLDPTGIARREVRVRWWDESATTYRAAALVPEDQREAIPDDRLPESVRLGAGSAIPTFVGHYWFSGTPGVLGPTMACLDYGAGKDGPLVAYRWSGEPTLSNDCFVWVQ